MKRLDFNERFCVGKAEQKLSTPLWIILATRELKRGWSVNADQ